MLTVTEVAERLGVSPRAVYRWIRLKALKALKFSPKVLRVREYDLAKFCESKTTTNKGVRRK